MACRYRNENYGDPDDGSHCFPKIVAYEINELKNADALEPLLTEGEKASEGYAASGDAEDAKKALGIGGPEIARRLDAWAMANFGLPSSQLYGIWLADRRTVDEIYQGRRKGASVEEYDTSEAKVYDDLGHDGKLFVSPKRFVPIEKKKRV